jgi:hypothetical protein
MSVMAIITVYQTMKLRLLKTVYVTCEPKI